MNTYTRLAIAPALALAVTIPLASPALAGVEHEDIVVTSRAEMKDWQANTTRTLNRALERIPRQRSENPSSGIVQLTFEMGDDGKPANIELLSSGANWTAVRTARRAVLRLGDISDVPVTNAQDARFLANIVFATSVEQKDELMAELERSERARLASGTAESEYITLGG